MQVLQIVSTVDNPRCSALANVRALMGSETSRLSTPAPLQPTSVSSSSSRPNRPATWTAAGYARLRAGDPDGDQSPNFRDTDSDADGKPDADEGTGDADGDGANDVLAAMVVDSPDTKAYDEPLFLISPSGTLRWRKSLSDRLAFKAGEYGQTDVKETFDDATQLAIRDQERAGIDVICDGEMRRFFFVQTFYGRMEGLEHLPPLRKTGLYAYDSVPRYRATKRVTVPKGLGTVDEFVAEAVGN